MRGWRRRRPSKFTRTVRLARAVPATGTVALIRVCVLVATWRGPVPAGALEDACEVCDVPVLFDAAREAAPVPERIMCPNCSARYFNLVRSVAGDDARFRQLA